MNYGGDMVQSTIKSVDPTVSVKMAVATRGKALRAEPISSMYEQGRIKHVGNLHLLEDQCYEWNPAENGPSLDRLDAMIWCMTELMGARPPMRIDPALIEKLSRNPVPGSNGWYKRHGIGRF